MNEHPMNSDKLDDLRRIAQGLNSEHPASVFCARLILKNRKRELRSKWDCGCAVYACEIAQKVAENPQLFKKYKPRLSCDAGLDLRDVAEVAATGSGTVSIYDASRAGCFLIASADICDRLSTVSEKKKTKGGLLPPNTREDWCDVQTRAVYQSILKFKIEICAAGAIFREDEI